MGGKQEIVEVAPGFARNYLHPAGLAAYPSGRQLRERKVQLCESSSPEAADSRVEMLVLQASEQPGADQPRKQDKGKAALHSVIQRLESKPVVLQGALGRSGALPRPIGADRVVRAVRQQMGVELSPALVDVPPTLDRAGTHSVPVQILKSEAQRVLLSVRIEGLATRTKRQTKAQLSAAA